MVPMIGLTGLGIDYSQALNARTALNAAADSAALAAATEAEAILQSPYGTGSSGITTAQQAGTQAAGLVFQTNAAKTAAAIGKTPNPTITVTPTANAITATVSYQTTVPTMFGGIFGTKTISISGNASSQLTIPKYINISVMTDISQSMGLAATQDGMNSLQQLTPDHCAFGCHVVSNNSLPYGGVWTTTTYESVAHANNISLRIDVIRQATQNMIQTAQAGTTGAPMITFGLYTLQASQPSKGLYGQAFGTLSGPSANYTALYTAAGQIDLGANNGNGIGDSDDAGAMSAFSSTVPANGTGNSSNSPLQYAFILTDGVQDVYCTTPGAFGSHCTQAFDPKLCDTLKGKGVTVGVIYTTYLQMPLAREYQALVASFDNQIGPNLQSCATPGWYYQANDGPDIQNAINSLFAKATGRGVLTQ